MFFYIGDDCPIKSMKQVEPNLFLDEGWNHYNGVWYKGYSTDCVLRDAVLDIVDGYKPSGKWCVIFKDQIYHPVLRGFPVYHCNNIKTNLKLEGYDPSTYEALPFKEESELTLDEVSSLIGEILVENTINFFKYNNISDLKVIFSAGLDTLTAWVVLDKVTKDYTLSMHVADYREHMIHGTDYDYRVNAYLSDDEKLKKFNGTEREYNSDLIAHVEQNYWGYNHACLYTYTNWNMSGYYAEVYTYRDGEAINAIANYHGKRIDELALETDYLYWFLKRPNVVEKYSDSMLKFSDDADLKRFLWSTIWYDHQMWNIDNNMFFSPFADIRIPKLVNRLSIKDITDICVTGQIQRNIIQNFRPDFVSLLADYKNAEDIWENFNRNFDSVKMVDPSTKIILR